MFRYRFLHSIALVLGTTLLSVGSQAAAEPPALEFPPSFGKSEDNVQYRFSLIVTVEGSDHTFSNVGSGADSGLPGDTLARFLGSLVKDDGGWKCSWSGTKLTIEGWTDPKTKKFHPTRQIRFECPNLPKAYFPVITPKRV